MDVPHTFPKRDGSPAVAEMFPEHAFWWLASPGNSPQDSMQSSIIPIMHTQQLTQCLLHSLQWKMFISPWRWWWHGDIHSLGGNILVHRRPWYNAMRRCMKGDQDSREKSTKTGGRAAGGNRTIQSTHSCAVWMCMSGCHGCPSVCVNRNRVGFRQQLLYSFLLPCAT